MWNAQGYKKCKAKHCPSPAVDNDEFCVMHMGEVMNWQGMINNVIAMWIPAANADIHMTAFDYMRQFWGETDDEEGIAYG